MSYATSGSAREIHSGPLTKMGGNIKTWRKRWMILKSDHTLQYFKEPGKQALGTINLSDPRFNVMAGSRNDCSWPKNCNIECSLVITTSQRTYFMFADTVDEADEWLRQLEKHGSGGKTPKGSLPSRYNKLGGNALDLETPKAVPMSDSQKPKMYKKKERRLPTKRFNNLDDGQEEEEFSEDDKLEDDAMDGELDAHRLDKVSSEVSITLNSLSTSETDSIYVLAGQTEERPRVTSPNSNNNNGREPFSSSVNVHESLYDLVGRINAGEEETKTKKVTETVKSGGTVDSAPQQDFYEIILQDQQDQDVYEPMSEPNSPMTTPIHKVTTPNHKKDSPDPCHSLPPVLHQSTSLGFRPVIPKQPSLDLYEPIDNPVVEGVLYEEIEQSNECLLESDSSDEEDQNLGRRDGVRVTSSKPVPLPRVLRSSLPSPPCQHRDSREESSRMVHNTPPSLPLRPPLPLLPKEELAVTYGNAPSLCILSPSPTDISEQKDDLQFYDNAPSLPPKPSGSTPTSPMHKTQRILKSPVPTPRNILTSEPAMDSESIYDDAVSLSTSSIEVVTPKLEQLVVEEKVHASNNGSIQEIMESNGKDQQGTISVESIQSTGQDGMDTVAMEIDSNAESVKYRSPPRKNSPRAVSAIDNRHDQGIAMFRRRAQDIRSEVEGQDSSNAKQMLLTDLESLNTLEKTTLAETLRAVEIEKHLASEERFKWERERLKLEEERKRFEEEKKLFQDQMRKLQALEQTKT